MRNGPPNRKKLPISDPQGSLDFQSPAPPKRVHGSKRVAVTTLEAYRKVAATMSRRLSDTATALAEYIAEKGSNPTSWELYNWQEHRTDPRKAFDISGLRSVLTNLRDRGLIYAPRKRTCTYSGETAMEWAPNLESEDRREVLPERRVRGHERIEGGYDVSPGRVEGDFTPYDTTLVDPAKAIAGWNAAYPIGLPVWATVQSLDDSWRVEEGRTATEAQVMGGRALIKVHLSRREGVVFHLCDVRPIEPGEDLPPEPFGRAAQGKGA